MTDEKSVTLKVVDENGVAVEGALVSVLRSTVAFPEIALVTDKDGTVRLTFPEGKFVIGADTRGRHGEMEFDSTENIPGPIVVTLRPVR